MLTSSKPVVSFGLPVYNGEAYLRDSLVSLLAQTFTDFEVVISDNCSTDQTEKICVDFAKKDSRIIYDRNDQNLGAAANFNRVVNLARGKFFAWANHDDFWGNEYLERCVAALDSHPEAVLAYTRSAKVDSSGKIVAGLMDNLGLGGDAPDQRLAHYHNLFQEIDTKKGWNEHSIEGLWMPVYGVMRANILQKTALIGQYIASDTVLIEELLMSGAFVEVDKTLFFKRDHPERSMRASVSYDKRVSWFTGKPAGRLIFPRWRAFWERLLATRRAPLSTGLKLACGREMLAFYFRRPAEGRALIKEVLVNCYRLFAGSRGDAKMLRRW